MTIINIINALLSERIILNKKINRVLYESVRHNLKRKKIMPHRKPTWLPMAPSKMFVITPPPKYSDEESAQRTHLTNIYDTNTKAIWSYFKNEFYLPTLSAGGMTAEQVSREEDEQRELLKQNEDENKRVADNRRERQAIEQLVEQQELMVEHFEQQKQMAVNAKEIDDRVKQELERSKTYITKENLSAFIEEALANPVTYDWAIDLDGNVHYDKVLHPYALTPNAIPETSSNVEEFVGRHNIKVKLAPKS